mgnify:CR=1 FL=1
MEKDEEPDDGLPKRKPDPHVGWNDMDDEYAFKYCALADYDNTAQAPAPAHVGAILKAIFIGNTLMCHSVRTEDGARAHHDPAAPLASLELPMGTHAKVVDEVAIAADPTLALADVAARYERHATPVFRIDRIEVQRPARVSQRHEQPARFRVFAGETRRVEIIAQIPAFADQLFGLHRIRVDGDEGLEVHIT